MNEQDLQLGDDVHADDSGLSTDDLAAILGLLTTVGQQHFSAQQDAMMPQDPPRQQSSQQTQPQQAPEAPKQPQEAPEQQKQEDQRDAAMEKEIADIRAELEKLQKEVGDTESPSEDKNEQAAGTTEDTESQG